MRYHVIYSVFCMMLYVARGSGHLLGEVIEASKDRYSSVNTSSEYSGKRVHFFETRISGNPGWQMYSSRSLLSISSLNPGERMKKRRRSSNKSFRRSPVEPESDEMKRKYNMRNNNNNNRESRKNGSALSSPSESATNVPVSENGRRKADLIVESKQSGEESKRSLHSDERVHEIVGKSIQPVWQVRESPETSIASPLTSGNPEDYSEGSKKLESGEEEKLPRRKQREETPGRRSPEVNSPTFSKRNIIENNLEDNISERSMNGKHQEANNPGTRMVRRNLPSSGNAEGPYILDNYAPGRTLHFRGKFKRGFQLVPLSRNLYVLREENPVERSLPDETSSRLLGAPKNPGFVSEDYNESRNGDRTSAMLSFKAHMHHGVKDIGNNFRRKVIDQNPRFVNPNDFSVDSQSSWNLPDKFPPSSYSNFDSRRHVPSGFLPDNQASYLQASRYPQSVDPSSNSLSNNPSVLDNIQMYGGSNQLYNPNPRMAPSQSYLPLSSSQQRYNANKFRDTPFAHEQWNVPDSKSSAYRDEPVYQSPVEQNSWSENPEYAAPRGSSGNFDDLERGVRQSSDDTGRYRLQYLDRYAKAISSMKDYNVNDLEDISSRDDQGNADNLYGNERFPGLLNPENSLIRSPESPNNDGKDSLSRNDNLQRPRHISSSNENQVEASSGSSESLADGNSNTYEYPNPSYIPQKILDSRTQARNNADLSPISSFGQEDNQTTDFGRVKTKGKSLSNVIEPLTAQLQTLLSTIKLVNGNLTNEENGGEESHVEMLDESNMSSSEKSRKKRGNDEPVDDANGEEGVDIHINNGEVLTRVERGEENSVSISQGRKRKDARRGLEKRETSLNLSGTAERDDEIHKEAKRNPGIMNFFEKTFGFGIEGRRSSKGTTLLVTETTSLAPSTVQSEETVAQETNTWTTTEEEYSSQRSETPPETTDSSAEGVPMKITTKDKTTRANEGWNNPNDRRTKIFGAKIEASVTTRNHTETNQPNTTDTELLNESPTEEAKNQRTITTVLPGTNNNEATIRPTNFPGFPNLENNSSMIRGFLTKTKQYSVGVSAEPRVGMTSAKKMIPHKHEPVPQSHPDSEALLSKMINDTTQKSNESLIGISDEIDKASVKSLSPFNQLPVTLKTVIPTEAAIETDNRDVVPRTTNRALGSSSKTIVVALEPSKTAEEQRLVIKYPEAENHRESEAQEYLVKLLAPEVVKNITKDGVVVKIPTESSSHLPQNHSVQRLAQLKSGEKRFPETKKMATATTPRLSSTSGFPTVVKSDNQIPPRSKSLDSNVRGGENVPQLLARPNNRPSTLSETTQSGKSFGQSSRQYSTISRNESKSNLNGDAMVHAGGDNRSGDGHVDIRLEIPLHISQNHRKISSRESKDDKSVRSENSVNPVKNGMDGSSMKRSSYDDYEDVDDDNEYLGEHRLDFSEDYEFEGSDSPDAEEAYVNAYLEALEPREAYEDDEGFEDNVNDNVNDLVYETPLEEKVASLEENGADEKTSKTSKTHIWPEHVGQESLSEYDAIESPGNPPTPLYKPPKRPRGEPRTKQNLMNGGRDRHLSKIRNVKKREAPPRKKVQRRKKTLKFEEPNRVRVGRKLQSTTKLLSPGDPYETWLPNHMFDDELEMKEIEEIIKTPTISGTTQNVLITTRATIDWDKHTTSETLNPDLELPETFPMTTSKEVKPLMMESQIKEVTINESTTGETTITDSTDGSSTRGLTTETYARGDITMRESSSGATTMGVSPMGEPITVEITEEESLSKEHTTEETARGESTTIPGRSGSPPYKQRLLIGETTAITDKRGTLLESLKRSADDLPTSPPAQTSSSNPETSVRIGTSVPAMLETQSTDESSSMSSELTETPTSTGTTTSSFTGESSVAEENSTKMDLPESSTSQKIINVVVTEVLATTSVSPITGVEVASSSTLSTTTPTITTAATTLQHGAETSQEDYENETEIVPHTGLEVASSNTPTTTTAATTAGIATTAAAATTVQNGAETSQEDYETKTKIVPHTEVAVPSSKSPTTTTATTTPTTAGTATAGAAATTVQHGAETSQEDYETETEIVPYTEEEDGEWEDMDADFGDEEATEDPSTSSWYDYEESVTDDLETPKMTLTTGSSTEEPSVSESSTDKKYDADKEKSDDRKLTDELDEKRKENEIMREELSEDMDDLKTKEKELLEREKNINKKIEDIDKDEKAKKTGTLEGPITTEGIMTTSQTSSPATVEMQEASSRDTETGKTTAEESESEESATTKLTMTASTIAKPEAGKTTADESTIKGFATELSSTEISTTGEFTTEEATTTESGVSKSITGKSTPAKTATGEFTMGLSRTEESTTGRSVTGKSPVMAASTKGSTMQESSTEESRTRGSIPEESTITKLKVTPSEIAKYPSGESATKEFESDQSGMTGTTVVVSLTGEFTKKQVTTETSATRETTITESMTRKSTTGESMPEKPTTRGVTEEESTMNKSSMTETIISQTSAEESTSEESTIEESTRAELTTEESATVEATTEESGSEESTKRKSPVTESTIEKSTDGKSTTGGPVTEASVTGESAPRQSTTRKSTLEEFTAEASTSIKPTETEFTIGKSTTEKSTEEESTMDKSTAEASTTEEFTGEESTTAESTTEEFSSETSTVAHSTFRRTTKQSTTEASTMGKSMMVESTPGTSTTEESMGEKSTATESTVTESIIGKSTTGKSTTGESMEKESTPTDSTVTESIIGQSTTEKSTTGESMEKESTPTDSTVTESIIGQSTTEKSTTGESTEEESAPTKSTVTEATTGKSTTEKFTRGQSTMTKSLVRESTIDKPTTEKSTTVEFMTRESATRKSTVEKVPREKSTVTESAATESMPAVSTTGNFPTRESSSGKSATGDFMTEKSTTGESTSAESTPTDSGTRKSTEEELTNKLTSTFGPTASPLSEATKTSDLSIIETVTAPKTTGMSAKDILASIILPEPTTANTSLIKELEPTTAGIPQTTIELILVTTSRGSSTLDFSTSSSSTSSDSTKITTGTPFLTQPEIIVEITEETTAMNVQTTEGFTNTTTKTRETTVITTIFEDYKDHHDTIASTKVTSTRAEGKPPTTPESDVIGGSGSVPTDTATGHTTQSFKTTFETATESDMAMTLPEFIERPEESPLPPSEAPTTSLSATASDGTGTSVFPTIRADSTGESSRGSLIVTGSSATGEPTASSSVEKSSITTGKRGSTEIASTESSTSTKMMMVDSTEVAETSSVTVATEVEVASSSTLARTSMKHGAETSEADYESETEIFKDSEEDKFDESDEDVDYKATTENPSATSWFDYEEESTGDLETSGTTRSRQIITAEFEATTVQARKTVTPEPDVDEKAGTKEKTTTMESSTTTEKIVTVAPGSSPEMEASTSIMTKVSATPKEETTSTSPSTTEEKLATASGSILTEVMTASPSGTSFTLTQLTSATTNISAATQEASTSATQETSTFATESSTSMEETQTTSTESKATMEETLSSASESLSPSSNISTSMLDLSVATGETTISQASPSATEKALTLATGSSTPTGEITPSSEEPMTTTPTIIENLEEAQEKQDVLEAELENLQHELSEKGQELDDYIKEVSKIEQELAEDLYEKAEHGGSTARYTVTEESKGTERTKANEETEGTKRTKVTEETEDTREAGVTGKPKETGETEVTEETEEMGASGATEKTKVTRKTEEIGDTEVTKRTKDTQKHEVTEETEVTGKPKETGETEVTEKTEETEDPTATRKSEVNEEAEDTKISKKPRVVTSTMKPVIEPKPLTPVPPVESTTGSTQTGTAQSTIDGDEDLSKPKESDGYMFDKNEEVWKQTSPEGYVPSKPKYEKHCKPPARKTEKKKVEDEEEDDDRVNETAAEDTSEDKEDHVTSTTEESDDEERSTRQKIVELPKTATKKVCLNVLKDEDLLPESLKNSKDFVTEVLCLPDNSKDKRDGHRRRCSRFARKLFDHSRDSSTSGYFSDNDLASGVKKPLSKRRAKKVHEKKKIKCLNPLHREWQNDGTTSGLYTPKGFTRRYEIWSDEPSDEASSPTEESTKRMTVEPCVTPKSHHGTDVETRDEDDSKDDSNSSSDETYDTGNEDDDQEDPQPETSESSTTVTGNDRKSDVSVLPTTEKEENEKKEREEEAQDVADGGKEKENSADEDGDTESTTDEGMDSQGSEDDKTTDAYDEEHEDIWEGYSGGGEAKNDPAKSDGVKNVEEELKKLEKEGESLSDMEEKLRSKEEKLGAKEDKIAKVEKKLMMGKEPSKLVKLENRSGPMMMMRRKILESEEEMTESDYRMSSQEAPITDGPDGEDDDYFSSGKETFTVNVLRFEYDEEEENQKIKHVQPSAEEMVVRIKPVGKKKLKDSENVDERYKDDSTASEIIEVTGDPDGGTRVTSEEIDKKIEDDSTVSGIFKSTGNPYVDSDATSEEIDKTIEDVSTVSGTTEKMQDPSVESEVNSEETAEKLEGDSTPSGATDEARDPQVGSGYANDNVEPTDKIVPGEPMSEEISAAAYRYASKKNRTRNPPGSQWPTEISPMYHVGGTLTWDKELSGHPEDSRAVRRVNRHCDKSSDDLKTSTDGDKPDRETEKEEKEENEEAEEDEVKRTTCYTIIVKGGKSKLNRNIDDRAIRRKKSEETIEKPRALNFPWRHRRRSIHNEAREKLKTKKPSMNLKHDILGRKLSGIFRTRDKDYSQNSKGRENNFKINRNKADFIVNDDDDSLMSTKSKVRSEESVDFDFETSDRKEENHDDRRIRDYISDDVVDDYEEDDDHLRAPRETSNDGREIRNREDDEDIDDYDDNEDDNLQKIREVSNDDREIRDWEEREDIDDYEDDEDDNLHGIREVSNDDNLDSLEDAINFLSSTEDIPPNRNSDYDVLFAPTEEITPSEGEKMKRVSKTTPPGLMVTAHAFQRLDPETMENVTNLFSSEATTDSSKIIEAITPDFLDDFFAKYGSNISTLASDLLTEDYVNDDNSNTNILFTQQQNTMYPELFEEVTTEDIASTQSKKKTSEIETLRATTKKLKKNVPLASRHFASEYADYEQDSLFEKKISSVSSSKISDVPSEREDTGDNSTNDYDKGYSNGEPRLFDVKSMAKSISYKGEKKVVPSGKDSMIKKMFPILVKLDDAHFYGLESLPDPPKEVYVLYKCGPPVAIVENNGANLEKEKQLPDPTEEEKSTMKYETTSITVGFVPEYEDNKKRGKPPEDKTTMKYQTKITSNIFTTRLERNLKKVQNDVEKTTVKPKTRTQSDARTKPEPNTKSKTTAKAETKSFTNGITTKTNQHLKTVKIETRKTTMKPKARTKSRTTMKPKARTKSKTTMKPEYTRMTDSITTRPDENLQTVKTEEKKTTIKPGSMIKPERTIKPETTIKPERTIRPETTIKPKTTIKRETTIKPETTINSGKTIKPETIIKPETTIKPGTMGSTDSITTRLIETIKTVETEERTTTINDVITTRVSENMKRQTTPKFLTSHQTPKVIDVLSNDDSPTTDTDDNRINFDVEETTYNPEDTDFIPLCAGFDEDEFARSLTVNTEETPAKKTSESSEIIGQTANIVPVVPELEGNISLVENTAKEVSEDLTDSDDYSTENLFMQPAISESKKKAEIGTRRIDRGKNILDFSNNRKRQSPRKAIVSKKKKSSPVQLGKKQGRNRRHKHHLQNLLNRSVRSAHRRSNNRSIGSWEAEADFENLRVTLEPGGEETGTPDISSYHNLQLNGEISYDYKSDSDDLKNVDKTGRTLLGIDKSWKKNKRRAAIRKEKKSFDEIPGKNGRSEKKTARAKLSETFLPALGRASLIDDNTTIPAIYSRILREEDNTTETAKLLGRVMDIINPKTDSENTDAENQSGIDGNAEIIKEEKPRSLLQRVKDVIVKAIDFGKKNETRVTEDGFNDSIMTTPPAQWPIDAGETSFFYEKIFSSSKNSEIKPTTAKLSSEEIPHEIEATQSQSAHGKKHDSDHRSENYHHTQNSNEETEHDDPPIRSNNRPKKVPAQTASSEKFKPTQSRRSGREKPKESSNKNSSDAKKKPMKPSAKDTPRPRGQNQTDKNKNHQAKLIFRNDVKSINASDIIPQVKDLIDKQKLGAIEKIIVYVNKNLFNPNLHAPRRTTKRPQHSSNRKGLTLPKGQSDKKKESKKLAEPPKKTSFDSHRRNKHSGNHEHNKSSDQSDFEHFSFDGVPLDKVVSQVADKIIKGAVESNSQSQTLDSRVVTKGTRIPNEKTGREFLSSASGKSILPLVNKKKKRRNNQLAKMEPKSARKTLRLTSKMSKRRMNLPAVLRKNGRRHWKEKIDREEQDNEERNLDVIRRRLLRELSKRLKNRRIHRSRVKVSKDKSLARKAKGKISSKVGNHDDKPNKKKIDEKIRIIYKMRNKKKNGTNERRNKAKRGKKKKNKNRFRVMTHKKKHQKHRPKREKSFPFDDPSKASEEKPNVENLYDSIKKIVGRNIDIPRDSTSSDDRWQVSQEDKTRTREKNIPLNFPEVRDNSESGKNLVKHEEMPTSFAGVLPTKRSDRKDSEERNSSEMLPKHPLATTLGVGYTNDFSPNDKTENNLTMFYNHMLDLQKKLQAKSNSRRENSQKPIKGRNPKSSGRMCPRDCTNVCRTEYDRVKNVVHAGTHYLLRRFDDCENCKSDVSCLENKISSSLVKTKRQDQPSSDVENMARKILHFASKIDSHRSDEKKSRQDGEDAIEKSVEKFGIDELGLTSEEDKKSLAALVNEIVNVQKNVNETLEIIKTRLGDGGEKIAEPTESRRKFIAGKKHGKNDSLKKRKNAQHTNGKKISRTPTKKKRMKKNEGKKINSVKKEAQRLSKKLTQNHGTKEKNSNLRVKKKLDKKSAPKKHLDKVDEEIRRILTEENERDSKIAVNERGKNSTKSSQAARGTGSNVKSHSFPRYARDIEDTNVAKFGKYRIRRGASPFWNGALSLPSESREEMIFDGIQNFFDLTNLKVNHRKKKKSMNRRESFRGTTISSLNDFPERANDRSTLKSLKKKSMNNLQTQHHPQKKSNNSPKVSAKIRTQMEHEAPKKKSPERREKKNLKSDRTARINIIGKPRDTLDARKTAASHFSIRRKLQSSPQINAPKHKKKDKWLKPVSNRKNTKTGAKKNSEKHSKKKLPKVTKKNVEEISKHGKKRESQTLIPFRNGRIRLKYIYRDVTELPHHHKRVPVTPEFKTRTVEVTRKLNTSKEQKEAVCKKNSFTEQSIGKKNSPSCICDLAEAIEELKKLMTLKGEILTRITDFQCNNYEEIGEEIVLVSTGIIGDILPKSRRDLAEAKGMHYVKPEDVEDVLRNDFNDGNNGNDLMSFPGNDINVPCNRDGEDITWLTSISKPNYTWTRDDGLPVSGSIRRNGNLELYDVDARDTGNYTCYASYIDPDSEELVQNSYIHKIQVVTLPRYTLRGGNRYKLENCDETVLDVLASHLPKKLNDILCRGSVCDAFIYAPRCYHKQISIRTLILPSSTVKLFPVSANQCGLRCRKAVQDKVALILIVFRLPHRSQETLVPILDKSQVWRSKRRRRNGKAGDVDGEVGLLVGCPAGYGLRDNHCLPCPSGYHSDNLGSRCKKCPTGTHQPNTGSRTCRTCTNPFVEGCHAMLWNSSSGVMTIFTSFCAVLTIFMILVWMLCCGKGKKETSEFPCARSTEVGSKYQQAIGDRSLRQPLVEQYRDLTDDDEHWCDCDKVRKKKKRLVRKKMLLRGEEAQEILAHRPIERRQKILRERSEPIVERVRTIPISYMESYRPRGGANYRNNSPKRYDYGKPPLPIPDFPR